MPARHIVQTAALTTGLVLAALEIRAAQAGCQSYQCGSNSPIIAGQPITNLDLTGAVHANVQLNPTLLSAPRCATDNGRVRTLTLGVDRGELTATEGAYVCRGADLVGAQLRLTVAPSGTPTTVTLYIASAQQMPTWERTKTTPNLLWSYRFEVEESATTVLRVGKRTIPVTMRRHEPLCDNRLTYEDWQDFHDTDATIYTMTRNPALISMVSPTESALVVQGAAFSDTGSVIKEGGAYLTGARWFNIACVGTSIAKMRLLGVDPMDELPGATTAPAFVTGVAPPGTAAATLKMLGARYDGKTAETKPGTPLVWARAWRRPRPLPGGGFGFDPDEGFFGRPVRLDGDDMELGPIEAGWSATGATCLSHFRPPVAIGEYRLRGSATRFAAAKEARAVARRRAQLGIGECDPARLPPGTLWVTTTVDHPLHMGDVALPEYYVVDGVQLPVKASGSAVPVVKRPIPGPNPAAVVKPPTGTVGSGPLPTANPGNPTVVKPPVVKAPVVKAPVVPVPRPTPPAPTP